MYAVKSISQGATPMSPTVRDGRGQRSSFEVELAGSGAGPVQRRAASDEERAGFAPRVVSPGLSRAPRQPTRVARAEDLTTAQAASVLALVNADRAEHGAPLIRLSDPPVTPSPEEPVMPVAPETPEDLEGPAVEPPPEAAPPEAEPAEPLGVSLQVLADAAADAAIAWAVMQGATQASRVADAELAQAEVHWDGARNALETCWRTTGIGRIDLLERIAIPAQDPIVVAAIDQAEAALATIAEQRHEQLLNGDSPYVPPISIAEVLERQAVRGGSTEPSTDIPEIIPEEPADDALEVVTRRAQETAESAAVAHPRPERPTKAERPAGGGPGLSLSANQIRVLEAVRKAGGSLTVAATALGTSAQSVSTTLRHLGERGGIPMELIPQLPAAFAKYTPAGL